MKRLQIRLPDSVHERLRKLAAHDQVSMNQFMVTAISNEIVRQETHGFFSDQAAAFDEAAFASALEEIPDAEPDARDRLPQTAARRSGGM